jgi:hypothetical protein
VKSIADSPEKTRELASAVKMLAGMSGMLLLTGATIQAVIKISELRAAVAALGALNVIGIGAIAAGIGAIGYEAIRTSQILSELRTQQIEKLDDQTRALSAQMAERWRKIADATSDPKLREGAEQMVAAWTEVAKTTGKVNDQKLDKVASETLRLATKAGLAADEVDRLRRNLEAVQRTRVEARVTTIVTERRVGELAGGRGASKQITPPSGPRAPTIPPFPKGRRSPGGKGSAALPGDMGGLYGLPMLFIAAGGPGQDIANLNTRMVHAVTQSAAYMEAEAAIAAKVRDLSAQLAKAEKQKGDTSAKQVEALQKQLQDLGEVRDSIRRIHLSQADYEKVSRDWTPAAQAIWDKLEATRRDMNVIAIHTEAWASTSEHILRSSRTLFKRQQDMLDIMGQRIPQPVTAAEVLGAGGALKTPKGYNVPRANVPGGFGPDLGAASANAQTKAAMEAARARQSFNVPGAFGPDLAASMQNATKESEKHFKGMTGSLKADWQQFTETVQQGLARSISRGLLEGKLNFGTFLQELAAMAIEKTILLRIGMGGLLGGGIGKFLGGIPVLGDIGGFLGLWQDPVNDAWAKFEGHRLAKLVAEGAQSYTAPVAAAAAGVGGGNISVTVNYPQIASGMDARRVGYDIARELDRRRR